MEFVEATDVLLPYPSLENLADEMGVSYGLIRQARMDQASSSYRKPPAGWQAAVAKLAWERAAALTKLADQLARGE